MEANHIFISYSKKDRAYVQLLEKELQRRGFETWRDEKIEYGKAWWDVIEEKLISCKAFIVVMSTNSSKSKWVSRECMIADENNKDIFPLLLNGKSFSLFINIQYADVSDNKLPNEYFFERIKQIVPIKLESIDKNSEPKLNNSKTQNLSSMRVKENLNVPPNNYRSSIAKMTFPEKRHLLENDQLSEILNTLKNDQKKSTVPQMEFDKTFIDTDLRNSYKQYLRTLDPDKFIPCPFCKDQIKVNNFMNHFDNHTKDNFLFSGESNLINPKDYRKIIKTIVRNSASDSILICPICNSKVKAKNMIIHLDRNHPNNSKIV